MNNELEIWKDLPGYEGLYQCSNLGRVKSMPRKIKCMNGFRVNKEKILKHFVSRVGYCYMDLGKRNTQLIHRLVAITFLENTENKPCVNHKNGVKSDNTINNLEWVTYSENERHSIDVLGKCTKGLNLRRNPLRGEMCNFNKFKDSELEDIKKMISDNIKPFEIMKFYKISRPYISKLKKIING